MKMHNLIRDMALHIMSATSIVKARNGLTRIVPKEYWTDALEKVFVIENQIRKFPLNMSPNCPKLSTFLLNRSMLTDVVIPDSFFKQLWGLKVLNPSECPLTELPNSISNLVNLIALLLRDYWKLRRIPYLGKLRFFRKLDIYGCHCLEALEGLEMLVNLRYLDLTNTRTKRLAKGTLGTMLNLQYLKVQVVNTEDIARLRALETLKCYFEDVDDFNKCVKFIKQSNHRYYMLNVDKEISKFYVEVYDDARFGNLECIVHIYKWSHAIVSVGRQCSGICLLIPQDVQTLTWRKCDGTTNLFDMGPLENLEELKIEEWKNLRVLRRGQDEEIIDIHDSPSPTRAPPLFRSLGVVKIYQCPKLKYLFGHGSKFYLPHLQLIEIRNCEEMVGIIAAVTSLPPHSSLAFPSLTDIEVRHCDKMKRVVESEWLPHFPILRDITAYCCEEIMGGPPPYMLVGEISLKLLAVHGYNNMRKLFPHEWLIHLRNLQSICVTFCKGMVEMISGAGQGQEGSIMTPINNTPSSFHSSISLPKLKRLILFHLPQLKSMCEVPITCYSMKLIHVFKCPRLNRIPLQLRLPDIEDLPCIELEDEEKWKTLIWDRPDAQAILQPYFIFYGNCWVLQGRSH
ncbi:putative disease resistance protein At4g19050 [Syzygium oleosum]|uniref:putative disease resistance protein At4g19050 n=1 Tax=Syzygium oleosum TaxID=219896 RepID=UPI0011D2957E|nr:putative disease resistance protein At4g19050 [Syzygium oleosum]